MKTISSTASDAHMITNSLPKLNINQINNLQETLSKQDESIVEIGKILSTHTDILHQYESSLNLHSKQICNIREDIVERWNFLRKDVKVLNQKHSNKIEELNERIGNIAVLFTVSALIFLFSILFIYVKLQ